MARMIDLDNPDVVFCGHDGDYLRYNIWEELPTVDAVPVVHGEWIPFEGETGVEAFGYKEYTTLGFRCSVCHADIDVSEQYFRYCPMCGSKMDGERKRRNSDERHRVRKRF